MKNVTLILASVVVMLFASCKNETEKTTEKTVVIEKQVEDISENFSNVIHEIANQFYNSVEKITEFKKENYPDFRQFISWESFFQDYSLSMTSYIRTLLELVHEDNKHDFYPSHTRSSVLIQNFPDQHLLLFDKTYTHFFYP